MTAWDMLFYSLMLACMAFACAATAIGGAIELRRERLWLFSTFVGLMFVMAMLAGLQAWDAYARLIEQGLVHDPLKYWNMRLVYNHWAVAVLKLGAIGAIWMLIETIVRMPESDWYRAAVNGIKFAVLIGIVPLLWRIARWVALHLWDIASLFL